MRLLYSIHRFDVLMFFWLNNRECRDRLITSCRFISKTGDGGLYLLAMALFYWQDGNESIELKILLMAFAIERPIYFILKNGCKRNRPAAALEGFRSVITPSDKFSFPSGHTSAAFMVATIFSHFSPLLIAPLYCWAATVGFSRVALGVHFPTDTLVGSVMGVSIAIYTIGYFG